jgi:2-polyprenyl-6-methoxyphenol hydroxylase-like FAD-dependent oxidoreductase
LKKLGIQATLYEGRPAGYPQSGTVVLTPNALRIFDRVGVYGQIQAAGYSHDDGNMINSSSGEVMAKVILGSKERYGYPAVRMYRSALREALLDEVEKQGIVVKYGIRCLGIESEDENGVTMNFSDGGQVKASFVIGADGINSKVRSLVAGEIAPEYTGQMFITGTMKRKSLPRIDFKLPAFMMGPAGPFAIFPADPDEQELSFFATVQTNGRTKEELKELGEAKKALKELLKPYSNGGYLDVVKAMVTDIPLENLRCWP